MNIYSKKDLDKLSTDLELTASQHYCIALPEDGDEASFDGYADVYTLTLTVFDKSQEPRVGQMVYFDEYVINITHEALCYYSNGE